MRVLALGCLLLAGCQTPAAVLPAVQVARPGEVIVRFKAETTEAQRSALRAQVGAQDVMDLLPDAQRWRTATPPEQLNGNPLLRYAQPNYIHRLEQEDTPAIAAPTVPSTPGDPEFGLQWNLQAAHFPDAWKLATGKGVTVAVIDSGVDPDHADLHDHLLPLIDEVKALGEDDMYDGHDYAGRDGNGHGTHVAGIIGAVAGNDVGIRGAAPDVRLLPLKVAQAGGDLDDAPMAKALRDAVDRGARVINLSIGGPQPSQILPDAMQYAFDHGVPVVVAAGNDSGAVNVPAVYRGAIAVAAIGPDGQTPYYSSHGPQVALAAPGGSSTSQIYSTMPTYPVFLSYHESKPGYGYLQGTSQAAPHVAAAVALMLERSPKLSPSQVWTALAGSADRRGITAFDDYHGFGDLDAERAVTWTAADAVAD